MKFIIFCLACFFSFSLSAQEEDKIYKVVEKMPAFPGCEELPAESAEFQNCAKKKMLEFIYKGLRYPKEAQKNGVEGMSVVQFVVNREGGTENVEIVRSLSPECDQAVLDVINNLPNWLPGEKDGKKVNVQVTLPIRFKMDKNAKVE